MAYQVIARKYRPQSFTELVGQEHVTQTLTNALNSDRFPHAILFNGPRGTGKTSTARIIAKTLLCQKPGADRSPCHECQNCQDVAMGRHLDVLEIDGASNNGVDSIRELRETVGYMPSSGDYKIYIIDEVHMLSTSAFNALLKTLEEPPAHIIFMFATTEIQKIPATILSRCQRFDFRTLSLKNIHQHLEKICKAEGVEADPSALWMLAHQAKGSIRDSLTLLDQVISYGNNKIEPQTVMGVLGLSDRNLLFASLKAFANQDKKLLASTLESLLASGTDPQLFLEELMELLRHGLMVCLGLADTAVALPENEVEELKTWVKDRDEAEIQLLFDVTLSGTQRVAYSRDPSIAFEMLMFKLLAAPKLIRSDQFLPDVKPTSRSNDQPASQRQAPNPQPTSRQQAPNSNNQSGSRQQIRSNQPTSVRPTSKSSSTPRPNDQPASRPNDQPASRQQASNPQSDSSDGPKPTGLSADGKKEWGPFVEGVKASNGFLGALLEHTSILRETKEVLTLGLPKKMSFLLSKLQDEKNIERTKKFLLSLWNDSRNVEIELLGKKEETVVLSPKAKQEQAAEEKNKKDQQSIAEHPLMKTTERLFKGQITHVQESKTQV